MAASDQSGSSIILKCIVILLICSLRCLWNILPAVMNGPIIAVWRLLMLSLMLLLLMPRLLLLLPLLLPLLLLPLPPFLLLRCGDNCCTASCCCCCCPCCPLLLPLLPSCCFPCCSPFSPPCNCRCCCPLLLPLAAVLAAATVAACCCLLLPVDVAFALSLQALSNQLELVRTCDDRWMADVHSIAGSSMHPNRPQDCIGQFNLPIYPTEDHRIDCSGCWTRSNLAGV